jgi:oligopeptide transport system substrate-binding protein
MQIFTLRCITLGLFVFSGCTGKKDVSNRIRMRLPTEPPSLDWNLATDNVSKEVIISIQSGLLTHDENTQVIPDLAESFEVSKDGKTYKFKIRSNAKWSDGQDLTAQHFVDSWERVLNPKTASEYAYFLFDVAGAEDYQSGKITDFSQVGVKAQDTKTLVVQLRGAATYWVHIPTFWITFPIRKDLIEKYGDRWTEAQNMVSAGTYVLKEWHRDSKIILGLNPHYYAPMPETIPEVEFRVVKDDSVAVSLFDTGDLDIVRNLPPTQLRSLAQRPEFHASEYLRLTYFGFNVKDPSVANPKIRKALALAIDKTEIEKLLFPLAKASNAWIPLSLKGADPSAGIESDPEAAKKLWSEIKDAPKTLEVCFDQNETYKLVAENLQNQWSRVLGVEVKLSSQEWKVYLKQVSTKAPAVFRMGWGADYPDPDTFMGLFKCNSGNNNTGFCNAIFDKNVIQASQINESPERTQLYTEAQRQLLEEDVAIIPLFQEQSLHLVSQRVKGFRVNLIGDFFLGRLRLK